MGGFCHNHTFAKPILWVIASGSQLHLPIHWLNESVVMLLSKLYDKWLIWKYSKRYRLMNSLKNALEELNQLEANIRRSGPVANKGIWIDEYQPGGRDTIYARLRADSALCPNGKRTMGLKRLGSKEHRDWQACIQRRDAIEEITRRTQVIQGLLDAEPIWRP